MVKGDELCRLYPRQEKAAQQLSPNGSCVQPTESPGDGRGVRTGKQTDAATLPSYGAIQHGQNMLIVGGGRRGRQQLNDLAGDVLV